MEIKPTLTSITTDTTNQKPTAKSDDASAPVKLQTLATGSDRITLTNIAETLSNLEVELQGFDGIDSAKVEQLRQAIEDGSYEVDVDRLVQNLLQAEKDLGE